MATKKSLPTDAGPSALGRPTIMDPALAQAHGIPYVHLVCFAIDVDRVREAVEGYDDTRPFGWEVFLTEVYLATHLDPSRRPEHVHLLEDVVLGVLEGEVDALGSQAVFAIWDAILRERAPQRLKGAFESWKARPTELVEALAPLFEREAELAAELAAGCLEVAVDPPLAPPTRAALESMTAAD